MNKSSHSTFMQFANKAKCNPDMAFDYFCNHSIVDIIHEAIKRGVNMPEIVVSVSYLWNVSRELAEIMIKNREIKL